MKTYQNAREGKKEEKKELSKHMIRIWEME